MNRWDGYNKSFLQHHGIKGQKWGVRRYQNNNGTWTDIGKLRRRVGYGMEHLLNDDGTLNVKGFKNYKDRMRTSNGIMKYGSATGHKMNRIEKALDSDYAQNKFYDSDVTVKKGKSIYRVTNTNKENMKNREKTYGVVTENDINQYLDFGFTNQLGFKNEDRNNVYLDKYVVSKELKMAGIDTAVNMALNKIGNMPLSTYVKSNDKYANMASFKSFYNKYKDQPIKNFMTDSFIDDAYAKQITRNYYEYNDKTANLAILSRAMFGRRAVKKYFNNEIFKSQELGSNMITELKDKGYNAVIDMEDSEFADLPIIIFDPDTNIKKKKSTKIDAYTFYYDDNKVGKMMKKAI